MIVKYRCFLFLYGNYYFNKTLQKYFTVTSLNNIIKNIHI